MALYGINTGIRRKGLFGEDSTIQPDETLSPQTTSLLLPDLLKEQPIENEPDFMTEPTDFGITPTQYNAPAEFGAASPEKTGMYWKQPVAGNMPLDRFVQMMGIGANALAPNEASGRMGAGLAQMAAQGGREERARDDRFQLAKQHAETVRKARMMTSFSGVLSNKALVSQHKQAWKGLATMMNQEMPELKLNPDSPMTDTKAGFIKELKEYNKDLADGKISREDYNQKVNMAAIEWDQTPSTVSGLTKEDKTTTKNVDNFVDQSGAVIPIDMNDPKDRQRIVNEKLRPYEKPAADKVPQIRSVDRGDVVDIYENGVKVRTEPKGKLPGAEPPNKVQQSQFTDPETGKPLVFDPKTQTYKVAAVEGSGAVAPRPVNMSATEREKTAGFEVIRDQLKRINETYKSKYVGLVSGRVGSVTQLKDPEEAGFRQVILDLKDSLLRARSGAQINEQEYNRLEKLVPDFNDSEPQFKGKMKSFTATFDAITKQRESAQKRGGVYIRTAPKKVGRFIVEAE